MAAMPEFARMQYAFAANIRDPEHNPTPAGVEERRMRVYRELFFNNVESFLSNAFPVLRQMHADADWHALVRAYFAGHAAQTPLFHEIPREFLHWLEHERPAGPADLPFLIELAHYEWVELALSIAEAPPRAADVDPDGDLLQGIPQLSPLAWHLSYRYPVHRIGPHYLPLQPGVLPTCLVVYRDSSDSVGFLEVNPVTKRLLELIDSGGGRTGAEMLLQIALEMSHPQPEVVISGGAETLAGLRRREILTGAQQPASR